MRNTEAQHRSATRKRNTEAQHRKTITTQHTTEQMNGYVEENASQQCSTPPPLALMCPTKILTEAMGLVSENEEPYEETPAGR